MLGQLWSSAPNRKNAEFNIEAHIKKEEFLRNQLMKEKKARIESQERLEKQNKDIKLHARLVVAGLHEKVRALEGVNQRMREEEQQQVNSIQVAIEKLLYQQQHEDKIVQADLSVKFEELLAVSKNLSSLIKSQATAPSDSQNLQSPLPSKYTNRTDITDDHCESPYEVPFHVLDSLTNITMPIGDTISSTNGKYVKHMVQTIENAELKKKDLRMTEPAGSICVYSDDDDYCENSPVPNIRMSKSPGKVAKKKSSESLSPTPKSTQKTKKFFSSEDMDLSRTRGIDDEIREKDMIIHRMEHELNEYASKVLSLEKELLQTKSSSQFHYPTPLPTKNTENALEELIALENNQAKIFSTCALSLLFMLIICHANEKAAASPNQLDNNDNDFSISNIHLMNGKSHRFIEANDISNFSAAEESNESRPLFMEDLSDRDDFKNVNTLSLKKNEESEKLNQDLLLAEEMIDIQKKRMLSLRISNEVQLKSLVKAENCLETLVLDMEQLQFAKAEDRMTIQSLEAKVAELTEQLNNMHNERNFSSLPNSMSTLDTSHDPNLRRNDQGTDIEHFPINFEVPNESQPSRDNENEILRLKENLVAIKKSMKERTTQSIEKIKKLQSDIASSQKHNEELRCQMQAIEAKNFESQVELQEAKQQIRSFIEDKKKLKDHYRHQMKEYQKQYDCKCREIKKLEELLIADKQRFKKLKESMKKIAILKTSIFDDSTSVALDESSFSHMDDENGQISMDQSMQSLRSFSLTDPELQRLYTEEIQKRIESKDNSSADILISELSTIEEELQNQLQAVRSSHGTLFTSAASDMPSSGELFDRIYSLQRLLESKHEECATMHEEVILLRSKLHLYEVFNANSVSYSGSPFSASKSGGFPLSPLLVNDEPMLHSDRKGEIRILRLKVIDLEADIVTLQHEKEELKSLLSSAPVDSNVILQSSMYKQLKTELAHALESIEKLKQSNAEWMKKYELSKEHIKELAIRDHHCRNDLEQERRNTLELLSELRFIPAHRMDDRLQKEIGYDCNLTLQKLTRQLLIRLISATEVEKITETIDELSTTLKMLPQEKALIHGLFIKLGPIIVAYSSFQDSVLDVSIAVDTLEERSDEALEHVYGFESY